MGDDTSKHYKCSNGGEFEISRDAEKVALESSPWLRHYMAESAKESNDQVLLVITLPENKVPDPTASLILQFQPRSKLTK